MLMAPPWSPKRLYWDEPSKSGSPTIRA
jgi:hypothetical protein